jgi:PKD repeat protein
MKIKFISWLLLSWLALPLCAQQVEMVLPKASAEQHYVNTKRSIIKSVAPAAYFDPKSIVAENNWNIATAHLGRTHGNELEKSKKDSIKWIKTADKLDDPKADPIELTDKVLPDPPNIALDFEGNDPNGSTPPDNHIAVSDDGAIISVTNTSLFFADENGNNQFQSSFSDYLSFLGLNGGYFDPKVMYDPIEDKFIMVVLNGSVPGNSSIVIGFSTTDDPNDPWWFYVFDGDPGSTTAWFDFPSIGVSQDELYISGNLFNSNDEFTEALIYQIDKGNGFTGGNVNWIYWSDIMDANGFLDFTIVPISYGYDGALLPGIFFVSSSSGGGNQVMLYFTTGTIDDSPNLEVNAVNVPSYAVSGDGLQLGTNDFISTNDTRILSGFYGDGKIHFVMMTEVFSNYTGLYYGRIDASDLTAETNTFGLDGFDYAFPSVTPFAASESDPTVLISFLRTGASIYPEFRVVVVDEDLEWSSSVSVKSGESFVDFLTDNTERWGDYIGAARRHLSSGVEVWVSGCYGDDFNNGFSNILSTWVAKINDEGTTVLPPITNFAANQTSISVGQQVNFTDLTSNNPTSWNWTFTGGAPNSSTQQNPVVTYNSPGTYAVSLTATNSAGQDTETKNGYITVSSVVVPPISNFTADQTVITEGGTVNFTDLSSNNPMAWNWTFAGGSPNSSSAENPSVVYNSPGVYTVALTASNSAGQDTETKNAYITVESAVAPPVADFEADQTNIQEGGIISYSDLSTNDPDGWVWSFPGGTPTTSTLEGPIIVYSSPGVYDVSLVASNSAGNSSITKTDYITVGMTGTTELDNSFSSFTIFPNPNSGELVKVRFEIPERNILSFFLADVNGRIQKHLITDRFKAGRNQLVFNSQVLAPGTYFLIVQDQQTNILRYDKIIIQP